METGFTVIVLALVVFVGLVILLVSRRQPGSGKNSSIATKVAVLQERLASHDEEKTRLLAEISDYQETTENQDRYIAELKQKLVALETRLESEQKQAGEKIQLVLKAKEELSNQFKVLANNILEEKTRIMTDKNRTSLDQLLNPLKERLTDFQKRIQQNYETEGKERHSLKNEVQKLMDMNSKLTKEAANLTNALKGDTKTQGNWGEMILERILEVSGLRKGEEYSVQETHTLPDGSRLQPDVVIHLPEHRHMVIDSKVSLNAYEEYSSSDDPAVQKQSLKAHIDSMRKHIKGLSDKEYQKLHGEKSPDFVVMFIPVESAFMLGISEDNKLWENAWNNNILLVSPSTLLFVMRIVMQLWRQEHRSQNAREIAVRGASLYDKLTGFVEEFDKVGDTIHQAELSFDKARNRLVSGRGNAIRQAELLKKLGVTTTKSLPEHYKELADPDVPE